MISKLKIILIAVLFLVLAAIGYKYIFQDKDLPYDFVVVQRGNIIQQVSATGQVIPAQKVDLQFEIQGKINDIRVKIGDEVKTNDVLATLETGELNAQIKEAQASCDLAQAKLDKLLFGASQEEIRIYETAKENAQIALNNAQVDLKNNEQNLIDIKAQAKENLAQDYEDAVNTLDEAELKLYNAYNFINELQDDYFGGSDSESVKVKTSKEKIKNSLNQAETALDLIEENPSYENIDSGLLEMKSDLDIVGKELTVIRDVCDERTYFSTIPSSDKSSLDNHKSYILTAHGNVVDSQQAISSTRLTNEYNINTAQAKFASAQNSLKTAQGNLQAAEDELTKIKAPARQVDIDLVQAELEQARANLVKINQRLVKAKLLAVIEGKITNIAKEVGEVASAGEPVISLMSQDKFQIEVDIPETDIGKIALQDPAEIILDAFPEQEFSARVIEIEPAETVIQGVVYYRVKLSLETQNEKVKPGMTANVDIITQIKENVLIIPQRAVITENGQQFVRLWKNKEIKKIPVETGLKGSQGEVEIISGLEAGEKVISFVKEK